jgi:hypothetical protein
MGENISGNYSSDSKNIAGMYVTDSLTSYKNISLVEVPKRKCSFM